MALRKRQNTTEVEYTVADFHSQNFQDNTKWMLNPVVFKQLTALSFVPEVDLFASRLNGQLTPFVSWKPEPGVWAVNAFSLCWTALKCYAFPPFSILGRVLRRFNRMPQGCWLHRSGPPNRGSHSFWSC